MKTKLFKTIALGLLAWMFLAPAKAEAQVMNPYQIMNNTSCKVTIRYQFYMPYDDGTCGTPCPGPGGSGSIVVPPGPPPTMIPIPAACQACGVRIAIVNINGTPVIPAIVAGFNIPGLPQHANGPDPGCVAGGMLNLDVHPHGADINP